MKLNKFANLLVIGLVLCVAASGCKKKPVGVTDLPGSKAGKVPDMPAWRGDNASALTTGGNTWRRCSRRHSVQPGRLA